MEKLLIKGGKRLEGTIQISGAKNAALPLMCATLLSAEGLTLNNLPRLADINTLTDLLNHLGSEILIKGRRSDANNERSLTYCASEISTTTAPYEMVRKMRASILVLGPLLAREGIATVSMPGGCAIGNRPIDLHLKAMEALGATIELAEGYVRATAPNGLVGGHMRFPIVSVGATENMMMAAALAKGTSTIENAAREPEIIDLANCLNAMGAKVSGAGSETMTIEGVESLHHATHRVLPDRIEAGSYAVAAAITQGHITLKGADPDGLGAILDALEDMGSTITISDDSISIKADARPKAISLVTQPFPGFPTDMQAQFMALATIADGASIITEAIFENRFMHVPELCRMGADITVTGSSATIRGVAGLHSAPVMATDLRASMSLVLAGLIAEGETEVNRLYHLDRGYEHLEEKLTQVGASIERVTA